MGHPYSCASRLSEHRRRDQRRRLRAIQAHGKCAHEVDPFLRTCQKPASRPHPASTERRPPWCAIAGRWAGKRCRAADPRHGPAPQTASAVRTPGEPQKRSAPEPRSGCIRGSCSAVNFFFMQAASARPISTSPNPFPLPSIAESGKVRQWLISLPPWSSWVIPACSAVPTMLLASV